MRRINIYDIIYILLVLAVIIPAFQIQSETYSKLIIYLLFFGSIYFYIKEANPWIEKLVRNKYLAKQEQKTKERENNIPLISDEDREISAKKIKDEFLSHHGEIDCKAIENKGLLVTLLSVKNSISYSLMRDLAGKDKIDMNQVESSCLESIIQSIKSERQELRYLGFKYVDIYSKNELIIQLKIS